MDFAKIITVITIWLELLHHCPNISNESVVVQTTLHRQRTQCIIFGWSWTSRCYYSIPVAAYTSQTKDAMYYIRLELDQPMLLLHTCRSLHFTDKGRNVLYSAGVGPADVITPYLSQPTLHRQRTQCIIFGWSWTSRCYYSIPVAAYTSQTKDAMYYIRLELDQPMLLLHTCRSLHFTDKGRNVLYSAGVGPADVITPYLSQPTLHRQRTQCIIFGWSWTSRCYYSIPVAAYTSQTKDAMYYIRLELDQPMLLLHTCRSLHFTDKGRNVLYSAGVGPADVITPYLSQPTLHRQRTQCIIFGWSWTSRCYYSIPVAALAYQRLLLDQNHNAFCVYHFLSYLYIPKALCTENSLHSEVAIKSIVGAVIILAPWFWEPIHLNTSIKIPLVVSITM